MGHRGSTDYLRSGTEAICHSLHFVFAWRSWSVPGTYERFPHLRKTGRCHVAGRQRCRAPAAEDQWTVGVNPSAYDAARSSHLDLLLPRPAALGQSQAYAGISPPPIETPRGWLMIYHGVRRTPSSSIYRLGLALFDLEQPEKCLIRGDS